MASVLSLSSRVMKNIFSLFLSVCLLITISGTAAYAIDEAGTTDAVIPHLKEDKKEATGRNFESISETLETLTAQIKALSEQNAKIREIQADRGADMTDLRERLEKITGQIEILTKDVSSVKIAVDALNARVSSIEKMLDLDSNKAASKLQKDNEKEKIKDMNQGKENGAEAAPLSDEDALYDKALKHFKEERFESAREEFETYLTRYKDSGQAANAMYWICECLYFEGNYEKAALAYETLIKTHPESDKIPAALFKQGLCFLKLGDKTTAKLLFQQLLVKYPQTSHVMRRWLR
ncbi:MAG: Cell division coordinator CpoB [Syntrophus sp. SKADARSKE-3]|nr:Cell division coordinator CpoB [Syntrophus sp. SKADARSKE-3]